MNKVGSLTYSLWGGFALLLTIAACPSLTKAHPQSADSPRQAETDARVAALDKSLQETRAELAETRAEIRQLRDLLESMNSKATASTLEVVPATSTSTEPQASGSMTVNGQPGTSSAPAALVSEDDWQILKTEVQQQQQDKVESGSKYRLRLWGLALFNAFDVSGPVDQFDLPTFALPARPDVVNGGVGGSLRQSIIGLTGTGPDVFGARTSGDVQMDFFGGLPAGYAGSSSGLIRLRVARIRFDWAHTSVVGGLDTPFFSPNSPTSYMSVADPAFAAAGNLWTWSPTIQIERRIETRLSQFKIEAGLLAPSSYVQTNSNARQPAPGENSRQPVYAVRFSANGTRADLPPSVGVSAIYFPQRFPGGAQVSAWGAVLDWRSPVVVHTQLSGEFFGGKGLDSFGGVPVPIIQPQAYDEYIDMGAPALAKATMVGGWSQLKFTINARNEFNVAIGAGDRDSRAVARQAALFPSLQYLSPRNELVMANYVFRPRSDLLFSPEYRRLRTYPIAGAPAIASEVGVAAGFLF
ncbi:MAG: hypothetical protein KGL02_11280 [Acidobacteriota bacterium]|nr:hypothetical protein [Acidobacteriota bacterium]